MRTAASASDVRQLAALAVRHDDLVAGGQVHCPMSFSKAVEPITTGFGGGSAAGVTAGRTGIDALLSQLGGGG